VVCIRREGQDVEKIISDDEILNECRVTRIFDSFPCFLVLFELCTTMDVPCCMHVKKCPQFCI